MRISDWSSDVCSSDLAAYTGSNFANHQLRVVDQSGNVIGSPGTAVGTAGSATVTVTVTGVDLSSITAIALQMSGAFSAGRSEEHTSEIQSLMRNSYAGFCLKKNNSLRETLQLT